MTFLKKENPVYRAFIDGLNEMERRGADRVILTVYEDEPSTTMRGRWIQASDYYPFEMLDETEQEMVMGGKHYTVVALVNENVGDVVNYSERGIEEHKRTRVGPFLNRLKPESHLNFVTEGGTYTGKSMERFAENAAASGWTPEQIAKRVELGIKEYRAKTVELMEKAGVHAALEKIEQRNTPFEQIMADMRSRLTD